MEKDTIVAIATAPGYGGIGVIRLSGNRARSIAEAITGTSLRPRHAHFCGFQKGDGQQVDSGIVLYFPSPNSFTGEDIVELQAHGGPVILDLLLRESCRLGARQALAGEFSQRAYLNGKIDLTQAEAIADLINSTTEQAALNAGRSLQGVFSQEIQKLVNQVTQLRMYVEAAIDFPEEEIDFIKNSEVESRLETIILQCDRIADEARQGSLLQEGLKLVIAGKPNAGKSSLLNALSGQNTAIVTSIEGTTRDVLREHIQIDGLPLHIVDTAGLRDSRDEIEQEGIRRAWTEIESADQILLVVDSTRDSEPATSRATLRSLHNLPGDRKIPVTVVCNKIDISGQVATIVTDQETNVVYLSAKTGDGMDLLREHLKSCAGYQQGEGRFSARRRHLQSLACAQECLQQGQQQLREAGAAELLADDLRRCQDHLGEITGKVSNDELLGAIFSSFCIGK
ncbi:MAG: tRNA uridine-5-carboxymethylaminomethyl(34) synthesis GTPase MnmE [Halioglobus sp.]